MTNKIEYRVVLTTELSEVETERLKRVAAMHNIKMAEYVGTTISFITDLHKDEVFSKVAVWLDYIGGLETIFCIQRIESHYTDFVDHGVKELIYNT